MNLPFGETIQKEQYYLDHFDFDYNILEKADSILGYKHTIETLAKMKGRQNLLGYKHTEETIDKLRKLQTNKKHSVPYYVGSGFRKNERNLS